MNRRAILESATTAVCHDRAATHGKPEDTFRLIAHLWTVYVGANITPVDAALMLGLLKIARAKGNPAHEDNFVDLAGYAACAGELMEPAPAAFVRRAAE